VDEYNRQTALEYEQIRDFLILHYKATERSDSAFWNHCRSMEVPDNLRRKMDLFRSNGRIFRDNNELFGESSWLQVMVGQRILPHGYHPMADLRSEIEVDAILSDVKRVVAKCVEVMPTHADFIAKHCAAGNP
jgi:tryptophan halogenase